MAKTTDEEEIYLKKRVALYESIFISYKKLLEEFHANKFRFHSESARFEWFRNVLTEGRNEAKIMLAHCQEELEYYRQGLNPPYIYKQRQNKKNGI